MPPRRILSEKAGESLASSLQMALSQRAISAESHLQMACMLCFIMHYSARPAGKGGERTVVRRRVVAVAVVDEHGDVVAAILHAARHVSVEEL